jgi:1,2-diacylglycerol 3-beta-galactosyltransferase
MTKTKTRLPKIVFLFSDTGGGHRSAAEALIEALEKDYPGQFETEMVDFYVEYAPPPLNNSPADYPSLSGMSMVWKVGYEAIDGRRRSKTIFNLLWPYIQKGAKKLVKERPADLYVSVHSLINEPFLRALKGTVPLFVVVTDLVEPPAPWYNHKSALTILPTEPAFRRGIKLQMDQAKMKILGLPVADRFCHEKMEKRALRDELGWEQDTVTTLMVGGGQGLGPLEKNAHAIDKARLDTNLVYPWHRPPKIYGFVREIPEFMFASDIIVTKAGPGTICESFIAGLPIILYNRIPGQEEDNVTYVVETGAGVWAPRPKLVVEAIQQWLVDPELRLKAAASSSRLARPTASRDIARTMVEFYKKHLKSLPVQDSSPDSAA